MLDQLRIPDGLPRPESVIPWAVAPLKTAPLALPGAAPAEQPSARPGTPALKPLPTALDDPALYVNRELSQLEFVRRVLEEAQDERNPLLERVKFLANVGSSLDEFYMVRVAGLIQQVEAGVTSRSDDGLTPAEQLAVIRKAAQRLWAAAQACLYTTLLPRLAEARIFPLDYAALNDKQISHVTQYFNAMVLPVLTPLAMDPGRPFPHISNLSVNLALLVRTPEGDEKFARLKVPDTLPRLVPIKRSSGGVRKDGTVPNNHYFVWLEQVIAANIADLFPGMTVLEVHPFQVVRNAELVVQELEADDLLESVEQSVRDRRFGAVVKLTFNASMPARLQEILIDRLEVAPLDVYRVEGVLGLSSLMSLYTIDRPDLKELSVVPATPAALEGARGGDVLAAIRPGQDILLHHPYDSFVPVLDFLSAAARDPNVLAIKQTLYRVGHNSPVVEALLEASRNGKQVAVLVELKARFDEASNITWAKRLEAEGVHVVYGLAGLKTHCKIALVVRQEGDRLRRYVHLATGSYNYNYNPATAQVYTDMGLFSCDEVLGADVTNLFNYLTGYSAQTYYHKLLVAPVNFRARLKALIQREIRHQQQGQPGRLIFKMNALADRQMIQLLYQASQAGVKVDLLVRGICCLRPGVPGLSDNIRVTSIVGRFLEHSRVYYFRNAGAEAIYLGSADLMVRNLDHRVEVLFPVQEPRLIRHLRDDVLAVYLADTVKVRELRADGTYRRPALAHGEAPFNSQAWLLAHRLDDWTSALLPPGEAPKPGGAPSRDIPSK